MILKLQFPPLTEQVWSGIALASCITFVFATNLQGLNEPLNGEDLLFARLGELPMSRFYELFSPYAGFYYRPLLLVYFQMMSHLFGLAPEPYHITGYALHGVFLWLCGLLTWRLSRSVPGAALTVGFLAFYPHLYEVYAVVGCMSVQLAAVLTLIGVHAWLCYRRGSRWGAWVATGAFVGGLCSKQEAVALLPALLALDALYFRLPLRRIVTGALPLLAVCGLMAPLQIIAHHTTSTSPGWWFGDYGKVFIAYDVLRPRDAQEWMVRINALPRHWTNLINNILPGNSWSVFALTLGACALYLARLRGFGARGIVWASAAFLLCAVPLWLAIGIGNGDQFRFIYLTLGFVAVTFGVLVAALWRADRAVLVVAAIAVGSSYLPAFDLFGGLGLSAVALLAAALLWREGRATWHLPGLGALLLAQALAPLFFDVHPTTILLMGAAAAFLIDRQRGPLVFLLSLAAPWAAMGLSLPDKRTKTAAF